MRITDIDCVLLTGRYDEPQDGFRSYGIVRIQTDDGRFGLGEPYAAVNVPLVVQQIVRTLKPHIIGQSVHEHARWLQDLYKSCEYFDHRGLIHCVLGSIDWAVHDLLAQSMEVPLCRLLNKSTADSVALYASTGLVDWSPSRVIDELHHCSEKGFRTAKIRVGCGVQSVEQAISHVTTVFKELGTAMSLGVDCGQQVFLPSTWTVTDAIRIADCLKPYPALFLEDALLINDFAAYRKLTEQSIVPIAGGEMFAEVEQFAEYLTHNALKIAQPDASVLAGPAACMAVDEIARQNGKAVIMHGWAGPVAQMQNIHAALAMSSCDLVEYCTLYHPLLTTVLAPIWRFENGRLTCPQKPGLGISLDDNLIGSFSFKDTSCLIA